MASQRVAGLLLTDSYELRMAASYLRRRMEGLATFSLFVRELPPEGGFLVAAGLEDCLTFLAGFAIERCDQGLGSSPRGRARYDPSEGDAGAKPILVVVRDDARSGFPWACHFSFQ